ncbi:MAG: type VI secretion protein [Ruthenibacterium sp.]
MDKSEMISRIKAGEFKSNNGEVLHAINILKGDYVRLKSVVLALTQIERGAIHKSVNFLEEEQYIKLRCVGTHEPASISDFNMDELEAKLTGKGIRLSAGTLHDDCIEM